MPETTSVLHMLAAQVRATPDSDALLVKRYGRWTAMSRREVLSRIHALALGFEASGVTPDTVVALIMRPHAQRVLADLALQLIGARVVGIPTGMPRDQVAHVLADSRASWVVVQNQHLADVVLELVEHDQVPEVARILYVDPAGVQDYASDLLAPYADVEAAGADAAAGSGRPLEALLDEVDVDHVAVINYTSGTTGMPRGVLLTHRNLAAATAATVAAVGLGPEDRVLSFRPMSDPVERAATVYPALVSGAVLALPESRATAQAAMWEIAPTYIHLTPRYIKSVATGIRIRMQASRDVKRLVNRWWSRSFQRTLAAGRDVSPGPVARALVGRPVLEKLGLDQARCVVVSGSRIATEGLAFFAALDLTVRPAYSLAEVGGFALLPQGEAVRRDTLGTPVPGMEVRIVEGHLLVRGPAVGAHAIASEGPQPLLDEEGWLHTGDAAAEVDGEFTVRGRLGDVVTLPDGSHVHMPEVEAALTASPYIREAVLVEKGERIELTVEPETKSLGRWATREGLDYTTDRSLLGNEKVVALLHRAVGVALEGFPGLQVDATHILTLPLAVADGTLTLTDKVRRYNVKPPAFSEGPRESSDLITPQTRESTGAR